MLDAEDAPLQRVQALDRHGVLEPEQHGHQRADVDAASIGAAQNRLQVLAGVEDPPSRLVGALPLFFGHLLVACDHVLQLVFVHVGVHPDPLLREHLMVLGAGQGREDEELEHVERQLVLDDLEILLDGFRRIVREAQNVTGEGHDADALPFQQHLPVLGDLVLALLGRDQVRRVDVLKPEEHAGHAGALGLLDEVRNLVAQRVDLDHEADVEAILFAQLDDAVVDRFPVLVPREIVVGDKEAVHALLVVGAQDLLDGVWRAVARLAPLHVDDGAERALEGATASGIETGDVADRAVDEVLGQEGRRRHIGQARQLFFHVVVDGLQLPRGGVADHRVHVLFGFAGEDRDADLLRGLDVVRQLGKHRQAARDVETAHHDLDAFGKERTGDIGRAGKFVRLNADDTHEPLAAIVLNEGNQLVELDPLIGLVDCDHVDGKIGTQHAPFGGVDREAVDGGERVGGHRGFQPLHHVAVGVVVRRFDQDELETRAVCPCWLCHPSIP